MHGNQVPGAEVNLASSRIENRRIGRRRHRPIHGCGSAQCRAAELCLHTCGEQIQRAEHAQSSQRRPEPSLTVHLFTSSAVSDSSIGLACDSQLVASTPEYEYPEYP